MAMEQMHGVQMHGTTIVSVRRNGVVVVGGDGQVTLGNTVMKGNARKVRRIFGGKVIAAVSVSGPLERLSRQPGRLHAPAVVHAANALTDLLRTDSGSPVSR